ncbi:Tyrosine-protein phosphatase yvh1 [Cytospora mali]|uniref:protein-tyrosine-phosphatase n=1 Tax=Cytospora mali TaxID=578113 RepID=A0A194WC01_CYTMA|nr:Tyrosine-protein phosphatase yvh1 [Valsa mali]
MPSPDDPDRTAYIDIDDDVLCGSDGDDDNIAHDVTSLSPGCCSRFAALTGLDINEIKRELANNKQSAASTRGQKRQPPPAHLCHGPRSAFEGADHAHLQYIEYKAMALSRIEGPDELYVGGIFALRRPSAMEGKDIRCILSMIKYSFVDWQHGFEDKFIHLSVDVDDVEDEDILVHLSQAVSFIDRGLKGGEGPWPKGTVLPGGRKKREAEAKGKEAKGEGEGKEGREEDGERLSLPEPGAEGEVSPTEDKIDPSKPSAVFVHCAMGKSRSVTAVVAFLLWKYPHRYGLTPSVLNPSVLQRPLDTETARNAVQAALDWVRKTREIAEPNPGFMKQLEMWVMMGMPADSHDAVEKHPIYQRWIWEREVEESAKLGKRPEWIRFEDDHIDEKPKDERDAPGKELRCKKCRRVVATKQFVIPHQPPPDARTACQHHFIEPLSWMKPVLDEGELEGRLVCPNAKCGASIGRYAWQGFKCNCREWVCPAFSLAASRVDEVAVQAGRHGPGAVGDPRAMGIRMPPGRQNL